MEDTTVEDKSKSLLKKIEKEEDNNNNSQWVFNNVLKFIYVFQDPLI
jgi:hypothetical protein